MRTSFPYYVARVPAGTAPRQVWKVPAGRTVFHIFPNLPQWWAPEEAAIIRAATPPPGWVWERVTLHAAQKNTPGDALPFTQPTM